MKGEQGEEGSLCPGDLGATWPQPGVEEPCLELVLWPT